jgi:hypothetical protein
MSLLNFPTNPNPGDVWTVGSKTYTWNGTAWIVSSTNSFSAGTLTITTSTNSTGTNSGALVVGGGAGIGGDLWIGGDLYVSGQQILTTSSFNAVLNEGDDIKITVTTGSGALVISNTSTFQTVTSRGSSTNQVITITNITQSNNTASGALVVSGGIGIGGNAWVKDRVNANSLKITDALMSSTLKNLYAVDGNGAALIDSYSLNDYRSLKYFVQVADGTGSGTKFHIEEMIITASNSSTAFITRYGIVTSEGTLGEFTATVNTTNVELYFTPDFATNKTIKMLKLGITV